MRRGDGGSTGKTANLAFEILHPAYHPVHCLNCLLEFALAFRTFLQVSGGRQYTAQFSLDIPLRRPENLSIVLVRNLSSCGK